MIDLILTVLVVLLPTLFAVCIEVVSKEIKGRPLWRVGVLLFGVSISALTGVQINRANEAHTTEVGQQHIDIESLRNDLRKSETDRQVSEAYLKAKLEDFAQVSQLGPALMKLAQTSADFERKQYENKVATNQELYDFTQGIVKKIRDFSQKYETLSRQQTDQMMVATRQAPTDGERQRIWNEETQKEIQFYYNRDAEFKNAILPDALYARSEMTRRNIPEPNLEPMQKAEVDVLFRGVLAGPYPELQLANYLDVRSKGIPSK